MKRNIIRIDEDKCNGCGLCVPSCAEGALRIVDGKARLVAEQFCDGLGACLGECPQGALIVEEREAEAFDEEAVHAHLAGQCAAAHSQSPAAGCPGSMARTLNTNREKAVSAPKNETPSELGQWPVQLALVSPQAAYFKNADLLVAADCVPFAYAGFHSMLRGKALAVGCPKLDNAAAYVDKLAEIIRINKLKSITVAHMEVPCCGGLISIVREAVKRSGVFVPVQTIKITLDGTVSEPQKLPA